MTREEDLSFFDMIGRWYSNIQEAKKMDYNPQNHKYVTHHTYTGSGCAMCGRAEVEHVSGVSTPQPVPGESATLALEASTRRLIGVYQSLCQSCVYATHPVMLTGYCILASEGGFCDRCGRSSDLAITKKREEEKCHVAVVSVRRAARCTRSKN